ncbi:MAG: hypothetical protein MI920_02340 [Kiloniellales bacterium]|nr:hypothetical protein [Kiloniellales bacterium]
MIGRSSLLVHGTLLLLCAGLAGVIYWELETGFGIQGEAAPAASVAQEESPVGPNERFALPSLESFAQITARPLFRPSRRPAQQAATPEAPSGPPPSLELALTGVVTSLDERVALLRVQRDAKVVRTREGEEIDGWVVQEILPDRVLLQHGATTQELLLQAGQERSASPD